MNSIVLLSGGIDSTLALHITKSMGHNIEAITVNYGQIHAREIQSARKVASHYNISHIEIDVDKRLFQSSALTGNGYIPEHHADQPDATYVPARNTVLLALAAARAESTGAQRIVIGSNRDDSAGYPDCRRSYLEAFREVLIEGTKNNVWVSAPLIDLTKKQVIDLAKRSNVPIDLTWSCYRGQTIPCGHCGACEVMR